jgi:hypothetical protein
VRACKPQFAVVVNKSGYQYNEKTGKLSVNKELVLQSKIRIETRQFHMSRRHPQQRGDRQPRCRGRKR